MKEFALLLFIVFSYTITNAQENRFQVLHKRYLESFSKDQLRELEVRTSVETFQVETIEGKTITFGKDSEKPTVLLFFTTWCPTCKAALPELNVIFDKDWNDRINIVAVGRGHDKATLKKWAATTELRLDIVADPDRVLFDQFASKFVPRIYTLDTNGKVLFQDYGWSIYSARLARLALENL